MTAPEDDRDIAATLRFLGSMRELPTWGQIQEAADTIESLRSRSARLEEALGKARAFVAARPAMGFGTVLRAIDAALSPDGGEGSGGGDRTEGK